MPTRRNHDEGECPSFACTDSLWFPEDDIALALEEDVLALVDTHFPSRTGHTPAGRGHDCAELSFSANVALSTDFFWQDSHFRTAYFTPAEAGAKALARAASDLAAAGALPRGFSLGLMLPSAMGRSTLSSLLQGMADVSAECGLVLTGGDISRGNKLGFCVTVWGESVGRNFFLRRKQAHEGDTIFLIGELGLAGAGFRLLEAEGREALLNWPLPCLAHLRAQPLLYEGKTLAELALRMPDARLGLMDVSDGLARDLPRLVGRFAADLAFGDDIVPPEVKRYAESRGLDAEALCLTGGEDYALLGTCREHAFASVQALLPQAKFLGRVRTGSGILRNGTPLQLWGFDHFSPEAAGASFKCSTTPKAANAEAPGNLTASSHAALAPDAFQAASSVLSTCSKAWKRGLLSGFNGNVSRRIPGSSPDFCITGTCVAKGAATLDDIAFVDISGRHVCGAKPSTETELHRAVYASCPESEAILHTHPPRLLALSLIVPVHERLALPLVEAAVHAKKMAFVESLPPGSRELAAAVEEAAKNNAAVWMERHGLVVHGPSLVFALALTEELEQIASIQLDALHNACRGTGFMS